MRIRSPVNGSKRVEHPTRVWSDSGDSIVTDQLRVRLMLNDMDLITHFFFQQTVMTEIIKESGKLNKMWDSSVTRAFEASVIETDQSHRGAVLLVLFSARQNQPCFPNSHALHPRARFLHQRSSPKTWTTRTNFSLTNQLTYQVSLFLSLWFFSSAKANSSALGRQKP